MHLLIDTTESKVAKISLLKDNKIVDEIIGNEPLEAIDQLLRRNKLELKDLKKIEAKDAPGSYTGLKVGFSVANALNFALGRKEFNLPHYP